MSRRRKNGIQQPPPEPRRYEIVLTRAAERGLASLPKNELRRVDAKIQSLASNSRPSECDSSWFAHFDSDKMMRHHRDVEKDLRYGLLEPEPARFWRSSACFGS